MKLPADRPVIFLKASSIPPGARWITLHPNGPGSEGHPVLIQPNPDGSAHVIGGAGGKLNYLKLRHVRSASEYKREAEERKKAKIEERKAQRAKDKEAGILEAKRIARNVLMWSITFCRCIKTSVCVYAFHCVKMKWLRLSLMYIHLPIGSNAKFLTCSVSSSQVTLTCVAF